MLCRLAMMGVLALTLSACGGGTSPDGPRVTVVPIKGQVLVDGKPAADLLVSCTPIEGAPEGIPASSSFTDQDGNFSISTFESGDGAPPGEYKLTFYWGTRNLMNGQYGGKDKLHNRYNDPETSEQIVVVVEGLPTELGVIELSSKEKE